MRGRMLVRDLALLEMAIDWVEATRAAMKCSPQERKRFLAFIERQPPRNRERFHRLTKRLRQGKVSTALGVSLFMPEAIGVFPGVGDFGRYG
jgi:hypothetical protein